MKTSYRALAAMALVVSVFTACNKVNEEKESVSTQKPDEMVAVNAPGAHNYAPAPPHALRKEKEENGSYASQIENTKAEGKASLPQSLQSSAAVDNLRDSTHLFIRTADIKCKVQNVANATYQIEDIARQLGGYVSYTNLTSTVDNKYEIPVSPDSSLQTINYSVQNTMVIRVPNTNLDSALKVMTPLVAYLDFRTIKANNTALEMLSNRLKQIRLAQHEERMKNAVSLNTKKLEETTEAEDNILAKQEEADNSKIANLALNDRVKYSTINLALYQPGVTEKTLVYNDKIIKPYEPGLLTQLAESAAFGWKLLVELILVFVKLWPVVIAAIAGVVIYKRWKLRVA